MKPRVSLLLLLPYTEQEPQPPPTPPHLRETGKSLKFSPSFPCSRTGIEPRIIPPSAESQICSALLLPAAALLCEGANCSSFCAASPLQIVAGLPPNCSSGFACRILPRVSLFPLPYTEQEPQPPPTPPLERNRIPDLLCSATSGYCSAVWCELLEFLCRESPADCRRLSPKL
ncbi:hypothetical protein SLEP1_g53439 [Rubroshorea leprosula]|uniref:Uncharacterized protein n=1 Tax=Rubroshorea leprosula TaxID=152421 RepID=A0AAV5MA91_9ROSI|nr:hypothetical protein SLEP1_g53439 [Rubroshorea leprosula]